jgi:uncharacterized membrane protein (DUF2068 family)
VLFGAVTIFIAVLFARALGEREIRSGLATYGLMTGATAVGLWLRRRWGRNLALLIALGNIGLGTLGVLAVILSRRGDALGPALLVVTSLALAYALSRRVFNFSDE